MTGGRLCALSELWESYARKRISLSLGFAPSGCDRNIPLIYVSAWVILPYSMYGTAIAQAVVNVSMLLFIEMTAFHHTFAGLTWNCLKSVYRALKHHDPIRLNFLQFLWQWVLWYFFLFIFIHFPLECCYVLLSWKFEPNPLINLFQPFNH